MDGFDKYVEAGNAAKDMGGFVKWLTRHAVMFYPRASRLVVTFDAGQNTSADQGVFPWEYSFIAKQGWSHLAVTMADQNDWYRHPSLWTCLDRFRRKGFFEQFDDVVFYGSAMGGYGALAFAPLSPGARVVALTPQTTLDPQVAPFETRFAAAFKRGAWSVPYADGAAGAATARQVYVVADPFHAPDARHVARLPQDNLVWLKTPHMKQHTARVLKNGGLLAEIAPHAWEGTLTAAAFERQFDALRPSQPFARALIHSAIDGGHYGLAEQALSAISEVHPKWVVSPLQQKLETAVGESARQ